MAKTTDFAKLFQNGRSQAVRLPREFRFQGDRVRIRRVKGGVLLESVIQDADDWFTRLDELSADADALPRRQQPVTPRRKIFA